MKIMVFFIKNLYRICLSVMILFLSVSISFALEREIQSLSSALTEQIVKSGFKTVVVLDFTDLEGKITELGKFTAEHISLNLAESEQELMVIDRTYFKKILKDIQLSESNLRDVDSLNRISNITGIEVVIVGNIVAFDNYVRLLVKVLDTKTAEVICAETTKIPRSKAINQMLGKDITTSMPTPVPTALPTPIPTASPTPTPVPLPTASPVPPTPTIAITPITFPTPTPNITSLFPEFPWPPPKASAVVVIPPDMLRKVGTIPLIINDVVQKFEDALNSCGYVEKTYYSVPEGFAIVTRLEQIDSDGSPKKTLARWATEIEPLQKFSLKTYIKALFGARVGYYRIIVFIFTPYPFSQKEIEVDSQEAQKWLYSGLNVLPQALGQKEYSQYYKCTALIYEFEQHGTEKPPEIKVPGRLTGKTHLVKANIWHALEQLP